VNKSFRAVLGTGSTGFRATKVFRFDSWSEITPTCLSQGQMVLMLEYVSLKGEKHEDIYRE